MIDDLQVQPFSAALLSEVRDFFCGDEPWQVEVAQWIKDATLDDGAVRWMQHGTKVWLYRTNAGELIGFGSLGTTKWRMRRDAPRESVGIIPAFAVALRFQGEPKHLPPEERYAARIMGDLISKAGSLGPKIVGLFVDKRNVRAIAFYNRIGFQALPDEGAPYLKMYLDLS
jgi:ribosomal protein S18 acetylase RimI-like enzyme